VKSPLGGEGDAKGSPKKVERNKQNERKEEDTYNRLLFARVL